MSGTGRTNDGRGRLGNVLSGLAVAVGCVLFLGGFVWGAVVYQPYTVPTESMTPTVNAGDRVLAQRISGADVRRGDVVVFKDKQWGDLPMVKRVAGVGGDKVACCDSHGRLHRQRQADRRAVHPEGHRRSRLGDRLLGVGAEGSAVHAR